jgi:hypothetical protein
VNKPLVPEWPCIIEVSEIREVGKQGLITERGRGVELEPEKKKGSLPLYLYTLYKNFSDFPVPSRDVTHQNLPSGEYFKYSRPGRVTGLVTSQLGTGKLLTYFTVYG